MKKIILSVLVLCVSITINAQIETPQPSPAASVMQKVGLTTVTIDYSRPGVKGRTIMGDLVPYGKIWRTGANARTKVTFSTDVTIDGNPLKKGTYAIFTKPSATAWDIYLYTEHKGSGAPRDWDDTKVAAQIRVTPEEMPMLIETFTMTLDEVTSNSAVIGMLWENTYVGLPFEVPTDALVSAAINRTMKGPSSQEMYAAAVYYLQAGKDIKQAQEWVDKAIELTADAPKFWMLRQQALIHAKAGNNSKAIAAAKNSLALAKAAGNDAYVKMNTAFLKKMGAM